MQRLAVTLLLATALACSNGDDPDPGDNRRPGDSIATGDPSAGDPGGDPVASDPVPVQEIDWAVLQHPATHTGPVSSTLEVFGRVFESGVTEAAGQGAGIVGEVAVGPQAEPLANWTFTAATYNVDDGDNDEYLGTVTLPSTPGTYRYAFRFRIDGGPWLWADLDGSDNGFDLAEAGTLVVEAAAPEVDWARVMSPAQSATVVPGQVIPARARVYDAGVTEGAGDGGVLVELGLGADGVTPDGTWSFVGAAYVGDLDGEGGSTDADDEFFARVPAPSSPGSYDLAVRARLATEPWLFADASGSNATDDLYDPAQAQTVTVVSLPANGAILWCNIQWIEGASAPTDTIAVSASEVVGTAYGRVRAIADPGPAETTGATGTGPTPRSEIGVGDADTDPVGHVSWTWSAGSFNVVDGDFNDEHTATLVAPALPGDYDWAWRFSMDDGVSWTVCDADGSTNGYEATQAGGLTVQ